MSGCATSHVQVPGPGADSAFHLEEIAAEPLPPPTASDQIAASQSAPRQPASGQSAAHQVAAHQVAADQVAADQVASAQRSSPRSSPVVSAGYAQVEEIAPLPERLPPQEPEQAAPERQAGREQARELATGQAVDADGWLRLPAPAAARDRLQISSRNDLISLTSRDAPLSSVLALIAEQHGLNVVTGADVNEQISVSITDAPLEDVLDAILATNGYAWTRHKKIIIVSKVSAETKSSPAVQGRSVEVFNLNYVAATDVDKVIQGLLSPVGQCFVTQSMPTDHRRTQEQLVVEDMPEYLQRIHQYLAQADTPPRQVQLEAHVLQVTLKDNCRHGVNFQQILRIAHSDVTLSTVGLASGSAPASMLRLDGADLDTLLEALKSTTDAKTLASPKVTVLNNQEARMQVGGKIGYLLSTTTQTSTLQSVNFLDVGVILSVLPSITADGQVVVRVAPEVSTGRINPTTQLPESETTQVETQVLLADGEAIVIGGLIKETDIDSRNKVPVLGDLWVVGWLFQRRETTRERNEIIITLVPRIVPDVPQWRCTDCDDVAQATTPLLHGALESVDRTRFEPKLPCYSVRPRDRRAHAPAHAGMHASRPASVRHPIDLVQPPVVVQFSDEPDQFGQSAESITSVPSAEPAESLESADSFEPAESLDSIQSSEPVDAIESTHSSLPSPNRSSRRR